jgi:hypothetical protein
MDIGFSGISSLFRITPLPANRAAMAVPAGELK